MITAGSASDDAVAVTVTAPGALTATFRLPEGSLFLFH